MIMITIRRQASSFCIVKKRSISEGTTLNADYSMHNVIIYIALIFNSLIVHYGLGLNVLDHS